MLMGIGIGVSAPATNNAALAHNPEEIASTAALRGTFRQLGGIVSISIATAYASRAAFASPRASAAMNSGIALSHIFVIYTVVLVVLVVPLVFLIPNQKGSW